MSQSPSVESEVKKLTPVADPLGFIAPDSKSGRRRRNAGRPVWTIRICRVAIVTALLAGWQFLPQVPALREFGNIFDPFFVSSPTRVASELSDLFSGSDGRPSVWPYIWNTLSAALIGTAIGMIIGCLLGLLLSNFEFASEVFSPFLVAINATPRVALIPIVIILFGPEFMASVAISILVVVFVAFYSAYEGGTSVRPELIQNAKLLGASEWRVIRRIRLPYVIAWTFASLPLALTFSMVSVVTAEILTGYTGMGALLQAASATANSSLTFAVVIVLSAVGILMVVIAEWVRRRVLHWWAK